MEGLYLVSHYISVCFLVLPEGYSVPTLKLLEQGQEPWAVTTSLSQSTCSGKSPGGRAWRSDRGLLGKVQEKGPEDLDRGLLEKLFLFLCL